MQKEKLQWDLLDKISKKTLKNFNSNIIFDNL